MEVWTIYKMELIKVIKRKNSLILVIPSILALLMSFAISNGALTMTGGDLSSGGKFACLDFISTLWAFFSGLGIWGILLILVAAFQFSGEIAGGQIKMILLRIGKRGQIILAKFLALLTLTLGAFVLFTLVVGIGYYLFIADSNIGSGNFSSAIKLSDLLVFVFLSLLHLALFMVLTFIVGLYLSPFIAFITVLISLFIVNYLIGSGAISFMKYSALAVSNQLISGNGDHLFPALLSSVVMIGTLLSITAFLFKKIDIK